MASKKEKRKGRFMSIDFVLPWVDGNDPEWIKVRNSYSGYYTESRYREWDILKYWFRSVETYAPWVRKVHLITCGQVPQWLNTKHPKLNLVFHKDYIPEKWLPTFSANPIELNIHRIKELSESFVYFNDDMYLCAPCREEDFFKNGLPCDSAILDQLTPLEVGHQFIHLLCNDASVLNAHFNKKTVIRQNPFKWLNYKYGGRNLFINFLLSLYGTFSGFRNFHLPQAFRKSDFAELWELEPELLEQTSKSRFREYTDINQYAVRMINLAKGEFCPRSPKVGQYFEIGVHDAQIADYMLHRRGKMICINDTDLETMDFEKEYKFIHDLMEKVFPEKSSFEL